jgi:hypothetical protein
LTASFGAPPAKFGVCETPDVLVIVTAIVAVAPVGTLPKTRFVGVTVKPAADAANGIRHAAHATTNAPAWVRSPRGRSSTRDDPNGKSRYDMDVSQVCDKYDAFNAFALRRSQTRIPEYHAEA